MIRLEDCSKIYEMNEYETHAISKINLQIEKGDFLAIVGPSGSGKTTLLNILGFLDSPSVGKYFFQNADVSNLSYKEMTKIRNKHVGIIFQNFYLIPELTVLENVEVPLVYRKISKKERRERAIDILTKLGMEKRLSHRPNQLSGGQQQRVAIARAMVGNPDLLLADEPTGNLDTKTGKIIMEIIKEFNNSGTTVILATHNYNFAKYSKNILRLNDGQLCKGDE